MLSSEGLFVIHITEIVRRCRRLVTSPGSQFIGENCKAAGIVNDAPIMDNGPLRSGLGRTLPSNLNLRQAIVTGVALGVLLPAPLLGGLLVRDRYETKMASVLRNR